MSEQESAGDRGSRTRLWWLIGAAAAVVVVVVVIAVWSSASNDASPSPSGTVPTPSGSISTSPPVSPAATSPAPDPDDSETEAPAPETRPTMPPVGIDEPAEPQDGLALSLVSIEPTEGVAVVPGETSGPALIVTVEGANSSAETIYTTAVVVNLYFGPERTPANILVNPRQDFPQEVSAGGTGEGVYTFTVPESSRDEILVEVDLGVGFPVVLFEGSVR